ncbi:hypothetical protein S245_043285 [Arachis hypogaea]
MSSSYRNISEMHLPIKNSYSSSTMYGIKIMSSEELRNLLQFGAEGSTVLVTTSSRLIGSMMRNGSFYILHGLSHQDSLSLFLSLNGHFYKEMKKIIHNWWKFEKTLSKNVVGFHWHREH